jgi:E3 ubiquitin-protein ligase SHPRH
VDSGRGSTYSYVSTDSTMSQQQQQQGQQQSERASSSRDGQTTSSCATAAAAAAAAPSSYPWQEEQQIVVSGSYGTKVEAVVRRVLHVLGSDPHSRVIVFSTWLDVLNIVSHALTANAVQHVLGRSRKAFMAALELFKGSAVTDDPPAATPSTVKKQEGEQAVDPGDALLLLGDAGPEDVQSNVEASKAGNTQQLSNSSSSSMRCGGPRVLLLLVSQGGLGLNLVEAQHVVLLEPLLDPAVEQQAISRVNRFGQTRPTHVHR